MVVRRRGRPDDRSMVRYPDPHLHPLRLERVRRMRTGAPPPTPTEIRKHRIVLNIAAWLLFLTGLYFVIF